MKKIQHKLQGLYTFLTSVLLIVVCAHSFLYFLIRIYNLSISYHFLDYSHSLEYYRMIMYSFYEFKDDLVAETSVLSEIDLFGRQNSHASWKAKKDWKMSFPDKVTAYGRSHTECLLFPFDIWDIYLISFSFSCACLTNLHVPYATYLDSFSGLVFRHLYFI